MSKRPSVILRYRGGSNVIPFIPARKAGRRTPVLAIALALVSLATACGMKVDSADRQSGAAIRSAGEAAVDPGFVYFPAQYVNQATEPSEHIEAY